MASTKQVRRWPSCAGEEDEGEENAKGEVPCLMTGADTKPLSTVGYTYGDAGESDEGGLSGGEGGEPGDPDTVADGPSEPFRPDFAVPEGVAAPETQRIHTVGIPLPSYEKVIQYS